MYSSNPPGTTPCVCNTVKKLSRVLVRVYDAALVEAGISITQLAALRCIGRRAGDSLSDVAAELEMERTSFYRAIAPMERQGWITVREGRTARAKTAALTPTGRRVLSRADRGWARTQKNLLGAFGEERWAQLVTELDALADSALG